MTTCTQPAFACLMQLRSAWTGSTFSPTSTMSRASGSSATARRTTTRQFKLTTKAKRQAILARGDQVWIYYYKDDLASKVAARPDIFKKVK